MQYLSPGARQKPKHKTQNGFTLIELSIVLVIIGLIIGGILTGQDLINAATIRAQISQIEKYNTAVRTFQNKYGFLPGDIPNPQATQFGFITRGTGEGTGNGNGIIVGATGNGGGNYANGTSEGAGETVVFWVDLSAAGLIDGTFNTATTYTLAASDVTGAAIGNYLPQAKIGQGNYVYIWAGGTYNSGSNTWMYDGFDYYGVSWATTIQSSSNFGALVSTPGMSVQQAYNIDKKIDDGIPTTGTVLAIYVNNLPFWTDPNAVRSSVSGETTPDPTNIAGAATTCYDNNHVYGAQDHYTLSYGGGGMNCALSFRMQ